MCLPCVPSLWAIVTSFKSLHSLRLSNVLFTYHSHTMNSYYNCSQYVVIIQLVSLRLCEFSFVFLESIFLIFSEFVKSICSGFLTQMMWGPFLGLPSIFFSSFLKYFSKFFHIFVYLSKFCNFSGFSEYFSGIFLIF